MNQEQNIDILGKEKISKLLFKFSIPCVMGLLIGALYNIVDQIFIGNSELGYLGNAATGVSFPVICIANAFAWCIGDGAASFLSICAGKKDVDKSHKCIGTGVSISTIISIILAIVSLIFSRPLMYLFGASDNTIEMAVSYFNIISFMFPFYLLLNVMNSMIRADGSPGYAMIAMLTGAIFNIILDPLFIYVFKWGIEGAAWATAIGQIASFLLCAIYLRKPKTCKITIKSFIPDLKVLKEIIILGGATFVTQISIVVMTVVANITLANYAPLSIYGKDIPVSVFSIQTKVFTIVLNIVTGIVLGGQPIFGYNYGAGRMDRVKETYKKVLVLSIIVGLVATCICQFAPEIIINLFGEGSDLYMEFAKKTFRIYLSLMTITCLVKMTTVFFQSINKPFFAVCASIVRDIIAFTPITIFLSIYLENKEAGLGINGILYASPIADIVALIVIVIITLVFFIGLNKSSRKNSVIK